MSDERDNYLRIHRMRLGFTQRELAFLLGGSSREKVSYYELGQREPTSEILVACQIIFGIEGRLLFPAMYRRITTAVKRRAQRLLERTIEGDNDTPEAQYRKGVLKGIIHQQDDEIAHHRVVMAIDPIPRGFGFAIFDGPREPIDWGVKYIREDKDILSLQKAKELIDTYRPDVFVIEDHGGEGSDRAKRIGYLLDDMATLAQEENVSVYRYSRAQIQKAFSPDTTKQGIAEVIAMLIPPFQQEVPPERKVWMSERYRMGVFDAVSLVLTYYTTDGSVETQRG